MAIFVTVRYYRQDTEFLVTNSSKHEFEGVPDGPFLSLKAGEFYFASHRLDAEGWPMAHQHQPNLHTSQIESVRLTGDDKYGHKILAVLNERINQGDQHGIS